MMRPGTLFLLFAWVGAGCALAPSDISLQIDTPALVVQRGTSADILVRLHRTGHESPVQVTLRDPPEGVSVEPLVLPVGQTAGVLHVRTSDTVAVDQYLVNIIATSAGRSDSDNLSLQVTHIPESLTIRVTPEQTAPVLEKGARASVSFAVDRSEGFSGSFLVKLDTVPWISLEPITVAHDATRFTLQLDVDARHPVGDSLLRLSFSSGANEGFVALTAQVSGPSETPPLLTEVTPTALAADTRTRLTLKGTGLSSTTRVSVVTTDGRQLVPGTLVSATSGEVQVDLTVLEVRADQRVPSSLQVGVGETVQGSLRAQTPAGESAWPITVSRLYVDPVTGSDTTGSGALSSPFASIHRAQESFAGCIPVTMPQDLYCPSGRIMLAPGTHRPGTLEVGRRTLLSGTGDLYGDNPSIIEGAGEDRLTMHASRLQQVKVTGYKRGLEAFKVVTHGPKLIPSTTYPVVKDVWLTGGDYGLSVCEGVILQTENAPLRISGNRIAGIHCSESVVVKGSAAWPVEILLNGDGSAEAGGIRNAANVSAEHLVVSNNRGPGVKVAVFKARRSTLQGNEGPGVWVSQQSWDQGRLSMHVADLGTEASPGQNTLKDNTINFLVDGTSREPASLPAVGNCWNPPADGDYADTTADGACGRIRKPFALSDTTYIDADGTAQVPFTWTAPPRFNYVLAPTGPSTPSLQF